jgi:ligand-binding sensor domain-containing protein
VHAGGSYLLDSPDRGFAAPVNALFEDQEGNLWAGGPWGIERWRDGSFTTYGRPEGLPSAHNGPVFTDLEGRTWFAPLEGGLYWLTGGQSTRVAEAGLATDVVYSITGNNHDLWVGRQRGGLTHLRDQGRGFQAKTFTQRDGLAQDSVYSVYQSHDGAIWAGNLNRGVSRYHEGKFTTYSTADGLASNTISSILETSNGTMWFATPDGLTTLSDHRWQVYTAKDGLPSGDVNCMLQDAGGVLWIGTAAGLALLGPRGVETPRNTPVALHNPVLGLAQDKRGSLWIATPDHHIRPK